MGCAFVKHRQGADLPVGYWSDVFNMLSHVSDNTFSVKIAGFVQA